MNKLLAICLIIALLITPGCLTINSHKHNSFPPENIVIIVELFGMPVPVLIEKGFFDSTDNWMTEEEYDSKMNKPEDTAI